MYGRGIFKGLVVTFKHFINTYVDDLRYGWRKYSKDAENFQVRQGPDSKGSFTVLYPDEKIAVPERFRFVPFLVVEDADHPERPDHIWCTSCGICAKVCPPQCIWIIRSEDPVTKRPIPEPEAFFIDIDICMNCGYCAEFCPFDAIKMDHDYELASYDRTTAHIHDKERLSKPMSYWKHIAPTTAYEEMEARGGWEHSDVIKAKKKQADADAKKAASAPTPVAEVVATTTPVVEEAKTEVKEELTAEERKAKREAALARKRAKEQGGE